MAVFYPDFKIAAIVTLDAKVQFVLPKSVREKTGFEPNGKIALLALKKADVLFAFD